MVPKQMQLFIRKAVDRKYNEKNQLKNTELPFIHYYPVSGMQSVCREQNSHHIRLCPHARKNASVNISMDIPVIAVPMGTYFPGIFPAVP